MFVLHVDLKVKQGLQQQLEAVYHEHFYPAVSQQPGFESSCLLRPTQAAMDYRLTIVFRDHGSQQQWVATDLHQQVWPLIENICQQYSVSEYTGV